MTKICSDLSNELIFQRFGQGVKLSKPQTYQSDINHTVAAIFNSPISVFFCNSDSLIQKSNEQCASLCGYDSTNQAMGKSPYDMPNLKQEYADFCIKNNQSVMTSNRLYFIEESVYLYDDSGFETLSIKLPWYGSDNKIIGTFGWSIVIGQQPLAETLSLVMQLGLLRPETDFSSANLPLKGKYIGDIYFSKRETECLSFYIRGKSAREIGNLLKISHRTVEQYLASLKFKMKVNTKSELIDKALQYLI